MLENSKETIKLGTGEEEEVYSCYDCGMPVKRTQGCFWRHVSWEDDVPYRVYCEGCYKFSKEVEEQSRLRK